MQERATMAFSIGRQLNQAMLSAHTALTAIPSAKPAFASSIFALMQLNAARKARATAPITKNVWLMEPLVK